MLDTDMKEQLRTLFKDLSKKIEFSVSDSSHEKQNELLDLLNDVKECSDKIEIKIIEVLKNPYPYFEIKSDGKNTGVSFTGVPGGHEFSSLILAVLNASGLGKMPDSGIIDKIKSINGGTLRTFVSLDCHNCPETVQALNLISLLNGKISHDMADGAIAIEEVNRLSVQGVPAIYLGDKLIHSGKSTLFELLTVLSEKLGVEEKTTESETKKVDIIIVGGGPAGVSAAIYSARKGLKTAIVAEKIGGQVNDTKGIENLISTPYTEGTRLAADLFKHIKEYDIEVLEHRKVNQISDNDLNGNKLIEIQGGERIEAGQVIIASGAKWRTLDVPGEKEYVGRGVAYCPHCDGPFFKGKKVAVIGGGNSGVEAAIDLANICSHVTLLEFGEALRADTVLIEKLKSLSNVKILTNTKTTEVNGDGTKVTSLKYMDRKSEEQKEIILDGVFVQIGLLPNSGFLKGYLDLTKFGEIIVDEKGRTSKKGVYAAGDVTTIPFKQIVIAMGDGAKVALAAFEDRMKS